MHQDEKLSGLIEKCGVSGYGRWCILVELMASQEISNESKGEYVFRRSMLCRSLRLVERTLNSYLTIVEQELNIGLTIVEQSISISYPNMLKYLGSYNSSSPNKEKKRKEIKQIVKIPKISSFDFDIVYNKYPKKVGKKKGIECLRRSIKTIEQYNMLMQSVVNYTKLTEKTETQFIKQFSTFSNCWEDYIEIELSGIDKEREESFKRILGNQEEVCKEISESPLLRGFYKNMSKTQTEHFTDQISAS